MPFRQPANSQQCNFCAASEQQREQFVRFNYPVGIPFSLVIEVAVTQGLVDEYSRILYTEDPDEPIIARQQHPVWVVDRVTGRLRLERS